MKRQSILVQWIAFALLIVALYQAYIDIDGYALEWIKRTWRTRDLIAMERSALYFLGEDGARFMEFIASKVPPNKPVIVAEFSGVFAQQSILNYFLLPRGIVSCRCRKVGEECVPCIQDPASFVPATNQFPPQYALPLAKKFVPYQGKSGDYLGLYIPLDASVEGHGSEIEPHYDRLGALLIDLVTLSCFGLLGTVIVRLILNRSDLWATISLSFPLGMGLYTWALFIVSYIGLPVTLVNIVFLYIVLMCLVIFVRMLLKRSQGSWSVESISSSTALPTGGIDIVRILTLVGIGFLLILVVLISIGRSYSYFDDIAIWSLKGHGIAYDGTIFAFNRLGGHGLAYPLNIPLTIAVFDLASGDIIPGSKLIFPLFAISLITGCYNFWRRWGVPATIGLVGIFLLITIPVIFFHSTLGYANLPFSTYLILGILWSVYGLIQRNRPGLLMGGIMLALSGWTRPEGFLFAFLLETTLVLIWLLYCKKMSTFPLWLVLPLLIPGVWLAFASKYILSDQVGGALSAFKGQLLKGNVAIGPLITTIKYGWNNIFEPGRWGLVFLVSVLLFVVSVIWWRQRLHPAIMYLIPVGLVSALMPVGLFYIESYDEASFKVFLSVSFDRAFIPAAVLVVSIAILNFGISSINRSRSSTADLLVNDEP